MRTWDGDEKMPSKTHLFLRIHSRRATDMASANSATINLSHNSLTKSHPSATSKESFCNLRLESYQTATTDGHLQSIWQLVSISNEHKGQRGSVTIFFWNRLVFVGRMLCLSFQIKVLSTGGPRMDHIFLHREQSASALDDSSPVQFRLIFSAW